MIIKFVMSKVPNIKRRFLWFGDKEAEGIYSFFFFGIYSSNMSWGRHNGW